MFYWNSYHRNQTWLRKISYFKQPRFSKCFTSQLSSLGSEAGLSEEEKELVCLHGRAAGLTVSGCAHAVTLFAYELSRS